MEDGFIDLAMYLSINKYFICFANAPHCTFAQSIKDLNNDTYLSAINGNFVRTLTKTFQELATALIRKDVCNCDLKKE